VYASVVLVCMCVHVQVKCVRECGVSLYVRASGVCGVSLYVCACQVECVCDVSL